MSRLPVRSPLPKSVPSTRSAPASKPSSVAATPVARSLCVCRLTMSESRFLIFPQIHSIWSAYTLGIATSTVSGRFKIILRSGVGCQISMTASEISLANSTSVALKLSRESWQSFFDELGPAYGHVHDLGLGHPKDHPPLCRGGRIIKVDDGPLRAHERFKCPLDQVLARLHQHLKPNILRRAVLLNQPAVEIELGVRGRGEAPLNFLEAAFARRVEQLQFLAHVHRDGGGRVPAPPGGGVGEDPVRPLPVGQRGRWEWVILERWFFLHGQCSVLAAASSA